MRMTKFSIEWYLTQEEFDKEMEACIQKHAEKLKKELKADRKALWNSKGVKYA